MTDQRVDPPAVEPVPLRRNWRFQLLWVGSGAAFLGIDAADIAYPLVILALTGSPAQAALFGVVQTTTMLLLGLPAGAVADRMDRRLLLMAAEGGRALAAGSVALALFLGHLTPVHLFVVGAVLGMGAAFGGPARMLVVRSVVPPSQLTQALTQEEVRGGITGLLGQPLGGFLYTARQALPFILCLATFTLSFVCALLVRIPPRSTTDEAPSWSARTLFAGVRELLGNPALRAALLLVTVCNMVSAAVTLVVIVDLRQQGASGSVIGLAMAGVAVGTLVGSVLIRRLHTLFGPGQLLLVSGGLVAVSILGLVLRAGPVWVFALLVCFALGNPAMRVLVDILIFRQVPDHTRGRTVAATMILIGIGMPTGSLLGGMLLQYTNVTVAVIVLAAVPAACTALVSLDRPLRQARWPEPAEKDTH
jgi:MFS family permease